MVRGFRTGREWLFSTRMARYPLATLLILLAVLALLWWLDPEFLRFLLRRTAGGDG